MRSNDFHRGLPYNIIQFTTLQEVMAGWLGLKVGGYHHFSDSLHIYATDSNAKASAFEPAMTIANADLLDLKKEASDALFKQVEAIIERLIDERTAVDETVEFSLACKLPSAFRNIVCVLCAEAARRRKRIELVEKIMSQCSNLTFSHMYSAWLSRVKCGNHRG
jgi:thymidylate synthase